MAASTASLPLISSVPAPPREHVRSDDGGCVGSGVLLERTVHQAAPRGGLVARGRAARAHGCRRADPLAGAVPGDPWPARFPPPALEAHPRLRAHAGAGLPVVLLLRDAADAGRCRPAHPVPRPGDAGRVRLGAHAHGAVGARAVGIRRSRSSASCLSSTSRARPSICSARCSPWLPRSASAPTS